MFTALSTLSNKMLLVVAFTAIDTANNKIQPILDKVPLAISKKWANINQQLKSEKYSGFQ